MTDSDVSFIVNEFVLGSTIENFERILLLEAFDAADRIALGGMSSGPEQIINTFVLDDAFHLYIKGNFPGYPQANYFLSQSNDSETALLRDLQLIFILVGISAVAVVFLLGFFVARCLTLPLNDLIEGSQDMADGNYDRAISTILREDKSNDEISKLALSFEQMRCSIRNNIEKITSLNMELVDKNGELEKAQDELINSERMSTVGKMVSIIIHDFKSPMQVIKGMTQLISMGNIDEEKRNDLIAYINKAINQMNNMTHDIFIRDNGPGIPAEIKDSLFEPFITKGKSQGTGLGLAIKKLVEDHKGAIAVESETGKGTTFIIDLPYGENAKKLITEEP